MMAYFWTSETLSSNLDCESLELRVAVLVSWALVSAGKPARGVDIAQSVSQPQSFIFC